MKHLGSVLSAPAQSAQPSSPIEGQIYYDTDVDKLYVYTTAGWLAIATENLLAPYPVGAIYKSVVSTSPATLFGGTWAAFGAGKFIVGHNAAELEFDTVEETGGVKEVTLTAAQSGLPAHSHNAPGSLEFVRHRANSGTINFNTNANAPLQKDTVTATATSTATDASSSHTNLPPYIVVYMWKRTA